MLLRRDEAAVVLVERHRREQPRLRQALQPARDHVDPAKRQQIVYAMQKVVYDNFYYTQLVNELADRRTPQELDGLRPTAERILEALLHGAARDVTPRAAGEDGEVAGEGGRLRGAADRSTRSSPCFIAITLNFVLFRALSGDAVSALRCKQCSKAFKAEQRRDLGLDRSKWVQYRLYLVSLAHGDLGKSVPSEKPVSGELVDADQELAADDRAGDIVRDRLRHAGGGGRGVASRHVRGQGGPLYGARLLLDADAVARPDADLLRRGRRRVADLRHQDADPGAVSATPPPGISSIDRFST